MTATQCKDQIIDLHFNQGMDARAIASQLGIAKPIGVWGVINQEKYRRNPASRPKPPTGPRPRKPDAPALHVVPSTREKTIVETREVSYAEPVEHAAAQHAPIVSGPAYSSPLFSAIPGIDRVEVNRVHAMPRANGIGIVGEIDAEATAADLQAIYGGGRYQLRAYSSDGQLMRTKSLTLAGRSRPVDVEEGEPGVVYAGPVPVQAQPPSPTVEAALLAQLLKSNERDREEKRLSVDEQLRLERERHEMQLAAERERAKADAEARSQLAQQQMQMMTQHNAQMMAIVQASAASANKGNNLAETLTMVKAIKELFGDDSGPEDPVSAFFQSGDKWSWIADVAKQRAGASPTAPAQAGTSQQDAAKAEEERVRAAGKVVFDQLVKEGVPPSEAMAEVQKVFNHLKKTVERAHASKQPVQNAQPTPSPAMPKPTNGTVQQATPAPAPPTSGPVPVESKAQA